LPLEYEYYSSPKGTEMLLGLLNHRYESANFVDREQVADILDVLHVFLGSKTRAGKRGLSGKKPRKDDAPYTRDSFNFYGDVEGHRNMLSSGNIALMKKLEFDAAGYERFCGHLSNFQGFCKQRGVHLFLAYPPLQATSFDKNQKLISHYHQLNLKKLSIPVLGEPKLTRFDNECFFDTYYHLNMPGLEKRTDCVINLLREQGIE